MMAPLRQLLLMYLLLTTSHLTFADEMKTEAGESLVACSYDDDNRTPGKSGLYDMTGGTTEWIYNWFAENARSNFYIRNQLNKPDTGHLKVKRGGTWDEQAWAQIRSNRWAKPPTERSSIYGSKDLRCVFDSNNRPLPVTHKIKL